MLVIYVIALGVMMFSLEKREILKIVIGERESEEKKGSHVCFVAGVILFIVSLFWSYLWYEKTEGNILLLGMLVSFIGIAICVGNSEIVLRKMKARNLFLYSDYLYYFKRNRSISLMLIALYGLLIFFNVTSSVTKKSLEENVKDYNPYDLVYMDYSDKEKVNMDDYARQCGTEVQYAAKIHFFYTRTNAVFGVDDVNKETGSIENLEVNMILETDRLYLREMKQSDFDSLCKILQDEDTMYAYEGVFSDDEVQQWLDRQISRYQKWNFGLWAVILKENDEMIGQCGLTMQPWKNEEVLEIGYLLERLYWHKGYAIEAARACKKYAFEILQADEVCSIIRDTNIASQNVAIRNGMTRTDTWTKHYRGVDMPHYRYVVEK